MPPKSKKKKKNNPFFHLKISELCMLNVPTKSAVGWNCIEPEATSLTMQGFMLPPCRFSCPLLWSQSPRTIAQTPSGWVAAKKWTASARFFARKICEKKCLPFRRNMGLKAREKISDHFLRFLVLVRLQGLFRKISHQVTFFSA